MGNAPNSKAGEVLDELTATSLLPLPEDVDAFDLELNEILSASQPHTPSLENETEIDVCTICCDDFPLASLLVLTCPDAAHKWCRECLDGAVNRSLETECQYPAKCCGQEIAFDSSWVSSELYHDYQTRKLEWGGERRLYCHEHACSTFIPPAHTENDVGTCSKCNAKTCALCKGGFHEAPCPPQDRATQDVLNMAKTKGWQQCYRCERLVERNMGCDHISKHISSRPVLLAPMANICFV